MTIARAKQSSTRQLTHGSFGPTVAVRSRLTSIASSSVLMSFLAYPKRCLFDQFPGAPTFGTRVAIGTVLQLGKSRLWDERGLRFRSRIPNEKACSVHRW